MDTILNDYSVDLHQLRKDITKSIFGFIERVVGVGNVFEIEKHTSDEHDEELYLSIYDEYHTTIGGILTKIRTFGDEVVLFTLGDRLDVTNEDLSVDDLLCVLKYITK